jgi:HSP20 family protein
MIRPAGASGIERVELKRITERIARLFAALQEAVEPETVFGADAWAPPVDVCETADKICVRVELPGVSIEQIKVGLTGTRLHVRGEKRRIKGRARNVSHLCSERNYGRFSRVIRLRWAICVSDATAELSNGVLLIYLPKIKDRRGGEFRVPIKET